jgi:hypothetical protein
MLLRGYLRDRPILKVSAVHPGTYQWSFSLPDGEHEGHSTRRYGFLAYIDIINKGRRDVSLGSWNLRGRTKGWKRFETQPVSIPEPQIPIRDAFTKAYTVLGSYGQHFQGETTVKSGASISGFCYCVVEFFGGPQWDLQRQGNTTAAEIVIQSVFGNTANVKITFREISLEKANAIIPKVANIDSASLDELVPPTGPASTA